MSCSDIIDVHSENFVQCKQCFKLVHKHCITSSLCLRCLPINFRGEDSNRITNSTRLSIISDFYDQQPYFSPFQCYDSDVVNFLPEPDMLSDNLHECSQILSNCSYYNSTDFSKLTDDKFLVSINIDGFKTNFDKFKVFDKSINDKRNILGYFLCETNVTLNESQPFFLDSYNKFVHDRLTKSNNKLKHKGSGIVIFLHEKFDNVKKIDELCISTYDFECICLEVITKTEKLILVACYHSPSGNFDEFINIKGQIMESINKSYKGYKCFVLGDFNVNLYNPFSLRSKNYLDSIFSNNFLPIISRATHFSSITPTCIDHILSNDLSIVKFSGLIAFNFNKHLPVFVSVDLSVDSKDVTYSKPRLRINDYLVQNFTEDLNLINSQIIGNDNLSAKESYAIFNDKFRACYDKWFVDTSNPNKYKGTNNLRKDWITLGLARSSEIKNSLHDQWFFNRTQANWNKYIEYKRIYDRLSNKVKYDYHDKIFKANQDDLKKTWKSINNILGRKRQNRLLTFPQENAAHTFNSYFVNIATNLVKETYPQENNDESFKKYMPNNRNSVLDNITIEDDDVKYIINHLNNSKYKYFSPRILKLVCNQISPLLTHLFNKCVNDGYFPDELKIAKVIPLYKNKGEIKDISNYRPISMLPVFSKIFEKLIHKKLVDFLDLNDIITSSQYGFRRKHSTLHALINATENVYQSVDNKQFTLGVFIDFSKAFDTVNHTILLKKLEIYGIRGNVLELFTSYLTNRKQYVNYGGLDSTLLNITCGVPQGSVLGPLLFILFVNDIVNISNLR